MARVENRPLTVSLFGATLPLPGWALGWLGVLILAGVAGLIVRTLWPATAELLSLKQAKAQMELEASEYGRHMWETPTTTYADVDGVFTIKTFADHCVAIMRRVGHEKMLTKLIPDLALDVQKTSGRILPTAPDGVPWPAQILEHLAPSLEADGRCKNSHAGQFKSWYGKRNGCQTQVWRQWPDGCTHYQVMNTCNGSWETNRDGSPHVNWTACRH